MQSHELEERTFDLLVKVADHVTDEELSLLCWHCGVPSRDVLQAIERDMDPSHRRGYMEDKIAAQEAQEDR